MLCPPAQLQNQSELRAPTAEKAAFYLDAALAARSAGRASCPEDARSSSHMLFTLHVYQYRVEKCGKGGSRCPRVLRPRAGVGGRVAVRGHASPTALCSQCLEAAAACTSSTWAAVRGRPAGAGRPPGAPRVCPCQPWAVSSWRWSAEPNTCPTGEWWAPHSPLGACRVQLGQVRCVGPQLCSSVSPVLEGPHCPMPPGVPGVRETGGGQIRPCRCRRGPGLSEAHLPHRGLHPMPGLSP